MLILNISIHIMKIYGSLTVIYLGIKLASETVESEGESMQIYKNLTAKKKKSKVKEDHNTLNLSPKFLGSALFSVHLCV